MKKIFATTMALLVCAVFCCSAELFAQDAKDGATTDALALMNETHQALYYAADGGKGLVTMTLTDKKGRSREREFWMFRTDIADMGDQNYYVYFTKPSDVKRTAVLTKKHAEGDDDRWLYIPSVDLVKRIAASDTRSRFVGSDFTYEDVSGRLPQLDNNELLPEEEINGKKLTVIKSTPLKPKKASFAWKITWIDPVNKLPIKEEYFNKKGKLIRKMTVDKVEVIDGVPTAMSRTMVEMKSNHTTTIAFASVSYEVELEAKKYTERLLKNPPASLR